MKGENKIEISIIIPVYNGDKYVANCIETIQNQPMKTGYEMIFVNDGSTDGTLEMIQSYAEKDSRIRIVSQENRGVSVARNLGIERAKGEWIVFMDVDDEIEPGYLEDISQETEANPSTPVFVYARHYVEKNSKIVDTTKFSKKELICCLLAETPIEELGTDFLLFAVWSKVYKKEFLQKKNIRFVEGLRWSEDLIFMCRIYQQAEDIKFIYRGYYHYIQNSESTIHRSRKDDIETIKRIQFEMKHVLEPIWHEADIRKAYYLSILNGWFIAISSELDAWKNCENFVAAYRHLKKIRGEAQLKELIYDRKYIYLDRKSKIKLFLLKNCPMGYLAVVRGLNCYNK